MPRAHRRIACGLALADAGCAVIGDFKQAAQEYGARFCSSQDCRACIFGTRDAGAGAANAEAGGNDTPDADADASSEPWATSVVIDDQGMAALDIGACLKLSANLRGLDDAGRCPEAYRSQQEDCHRRACAQCATHGKPAYEECKALSDRGSCEKTLERTCAIELADAGCDVSNDFVFTAYLYALAFCRSTN